MYSVHTTIHRLPTVSRNRSVEDYSDISIVEVVWWVTSITTLIRQRGVVVLKYMKIIRWLIQCQVYCSECLYNFSKVAYCFWCPLEKNQFVIQECPDFNEKLCASINDFVRWSIFFQPQRTIRRCWFDFHFQWQSLLGPCSSQISDLPQNGDSPKSPATKTRKLANFFRVEVTSICL